MNTIEATSGTNSVDIEIDQGTTGVYILTITDGIDPIDISDWEGVLQVRSGFGGRLLIEKTTETGGGIELTDPTNGVLTITIEPEDTTNVRIPVGEETLDCVFDLELTTDTGKVYKPARGTFTINTEITTTED